MKKSLFSLFAAALALAGCGQSATGGGESRQEIRIVGSSTVYPFTQAVAERFAQANAAFRPPVVESTGTGAGIKLFCGGVGAGHPDIANASRRIKASEFQQCAANGVDQIIEMQIGIDGLALSNRRSIRPISRSPRATSMQRSRRTRSASRRPRKPGTTSIRRCPPCRSRSTARRRPPARATALAELILEQRLRHRSRDGSAEGLRQRPPQAGLHPYPRGRRVYRGGRERQSDRPERRRKCRTRSASSAIPISRRTATGCTAMPLERGRADLCDDRELHLSRMRARSTSTSRASISMRSRACASSSPLMRQAWGPGGYLVKRGLIAAPGRGTRGGARDRPEPASARPGRHPLGSGRTRDFDHHRLAAARARPRRPGWPPARKAMAFVRGGDGRPHSLPHITAGTSRCGRWCPR